MNTLAYILAEKEFGWVQIVVVAIFFLVSIVASIFQKAKEKEQKAQSRKPKPSARQQKQAPAPRTVQPTRPVPPPAPAAGQTVRVSEDLRLRQQRQAQLDSERQQRLASRNPPESDTAAIEARLVGIRPDQADTAPGQISRVGVVLQLKTRDDAQKAIIMHEIFSPPKALRKGGEIWDS
ncbi:MAG: hypothetical protein ISS69_16390 [Phycisphaerae bacterium]|nr:hypothetical protein [Phycisphaerae bacterium]